MKFDNVLIDASSIMNFFRYYHQYYSKHNHKIIFEGLKDFLVNKIKLGEIIILDKVFDELKSKDYDDFKEEIKDSVINSLIIFDAVQDLMMKYYIVENEKFYDNNKTRIDADLEKYETTYADLYLIAYANLLKSQEKKVILITEESFVKDKKLIDKIPKICHKDNENIWCRNLPYALFDFYKEELDFTLDIKK